MAKLTCDNGYTSVDCNLSDMTIIQSAGTVKLYGGTYGCLGVNWEFSPGEMLVNGVALYLIKEDLGTGKASQVVFGDIHDTTIHIDLNAYDAVYHSTPVEPSSTGAQLNFTLKGDDLSVSRTRITHLKVGCDFVASFKRTFP